MADWKIFKEGDPEEWRPCPGFERMYDVSSLGNVRSYHTSKGKVDRSSVPKFRKPGYSPKFLYWSVNLRKLKKPYTIPLHILVAKAFVRNPNPKLRRYVNHENGQKDCNAAFNLSWVTLGENQEHAYRTGLRERPNGTLNGRSKLQPFEALEIFNSSENQYKIASQYSITRSVIQRIKNGRLWSSVTGKEYTPPAPKRKFSEQEIMNIFNAEGYLKEIGERFGISASLAQSIKCGRLYSKITGKVFTGKTEYTYFGVTNKVSAW